MSQVRNRTSYVTDIVDFQQSPHKINKKAYALKIDKRSLDNMFLGRIGFNMFKIPEGEYTICVEFFPGKMDGVNVNAVSTALNVNRQATKDFVSYSRSIIHIHKWKHFFSRVTHVGFEMAGQS